MQAKQSIHEFTGFSTLKDAFISMLMEAADLVEKNFATNAEKETWCEQCWLNYGDDIAEFLIGTLSPEHANAEEDDLIYYCDMYDLTEAIKANSESFFGWNITNYLEN